MGIRGFIEEACLDVDDEGDAGDVELWTDWN